VNSPITFAPPAYAHLIPSEEGDILEPQKAKEVKNNNSTDLETDLEVPSSFIALLPGGADNHSVTTIPPEW
jgi:hypothetical protein